MPKSRNARPRNSSPKRAATAGRSGTTKAKAAPGRAPRAPAKPPAPAVPTRRAASPVIPGRGPKLPGEVVGGGIEESTDEEIREAGREGAAAAPRQHVTGTNPATGQITEVETTAPPPPVGDGTTSTKSTK